MTKHQLHLLEIQSNTVHTILMTSNVSQDCVRPLESLIVCLRLWFCFLGLLHGASATTVATLSDINSQDDEFVGCSLTMIKFLSNLENHQNYPFVMSEADFFIVCFVRSPNFTGKVYDSNKILMLIRAISLHLYSLRMRKSSRYLQVYSKFFDT